VLSRQP
jgi:deaminated glutathione amidase